jgi:DNA-binding transcriptional LysR family regulator
MRLTLDALAVLDAIDRKGSFAAAAEELHRVPSAITYTVQKLEQDLAVTLFDRSGHRARLTSAGKQLLNDGRHLLAAADQLEAAVRRIATGWEAELRIAVGDLIPIDWLYPLCQDFYSQRQGTRLRLSTEVLGGTWDALASGRADLVVGAAGDAPAGGGYTTRPIGTVEFVFVVPPGHPLVREPEPLTEKTILQHRAVAVGDTSRSLPPRTSALLSGQDVLTVPSMAAKCEAHRQGLGVGYVPRFWVEHDLAQGGLVAKEVESSLPNPQLFIVWRSRHKGRALEWFLDRLNHWQLDGASKTPKPGPF